MILNTDQGAQFSSTEWIERLKASQVRISMDGRGRALDNVFVVRLWRTVKHEDVYLRGYDTPAALKQGPNAYFRFYNKAGTLTPTERPPDFTTSPRSVVRKMGATPVH